MPSPVSPPVESQNSWVDTQPYSPEPPDDNPFEFLESQDTQRELSQSSSFFRVPGTPVHSQRTFSFGSQARVPDVGEPPHLRNRNLYVLNGPNERQVPESRTPHVLPALKRWATAPCTFPFAPQSRTK